MSPPSSLCSGTPNKGCPSSTSCAAASAPSPARSTTTSSTNQTPHPPASNRSVNEPHQPQTRQSGTLACCSVTCVLFQAATANLNPWTEDQVDTKNPDRGPLLLLSGELDQTVPWAIVNASYQQQQDNPGVTEIVKIKGRGHALTIDSGWREVADTALAFVKRFT
jgi:pimeloyl-ACP methyl ester carboxylesterase